MSTLLQTTPKDANSRINITDGTATPTHFSNAIPYDGTNVAISTAGAIAGHVMGLPITSVGRLCTIDAVPTSYTSGAAPFNSGRLATSSVNPTHYNGGVGYSSDNRVSITSAALTGVVIVTNPVSVEVSVFSSPTFSVTATGSPTLTYQWQRSVNGVGAWTNITDTPGADGYSGATTATLTCITVSTAQDGDQFRCVVTNPVNSATSTGATLLVAA